MGLLDAPAYSDRSERQAYGRTLRRRLATRTLVAPMTTPPTLAWSTAATATPLTGNVRPTGTGQAISRFLGTPRLDAVNGVYSNGCNNGESTLIQEEFDFLGSDMCYIWRALASPGFRIYVDEQSVDPNDATIAPGISTSAGTLYRVRITFAARALRRIRIEATGIQQRTWETNDADRIAPTPRAKDQCVVYGDSWVGGALSSGPFDVWPRTFGRLMGWEVLNAGQGGTGYVKDADAAFGARDPFATPARIQAAAATKPEWAVIYGSLNDEAPVGNNTGDAATSVYQQWATASPDTKLIVVGVQSVNTPVPAAYSANRDQTKVAALAAPNVLGYIDQISGLWYTPNGKSGGLGSAWISGTGNSANAGTGTCCLYIGSDGIHPTQQGHDYLANRIAADVVQIIQAA